MEKYLVDTSVFINHYRGDTIASDFLAENETSLVVSFVTAGELLQGVRSKRELEEIQKGLVHLTVVWGSEHITEYSHELLVTHTLSHGLRLLDALQAAIALTYHYTLVTDNVKHFSYIPRLAAETPKRLMKGGE